MHSCEMHGHYLVKLHIMQMWGQQTRHWANAVQMLIRVFTFEPHWPSIGSMSHVFWQGWVWHAELCDFLKQYLHICLSYQFHHCFSHTHIDHVDVLTISMCLTPLIDSVVPLHAGIIWTVICISLWISTPMHSFGNENFYAHSCKTFTCVRIMQIYNKTLCIIWFSSDCLNLPRRCPSAGVVIFWFDIIFVFKQDL